MIRVITLISIAALCAAESTVPMPMCDRDSCDCPLPNTTPGDLKHITDGSPTGCLCQCGRDMAEGCENTDHCAQGSECIAPSDFSTVADKSLGICTDRCKRHKCNQFYHCEVINGMATCVCQNFRCRNDVNIPVSALRQTTSGTIETTSFLNSCHMVNENCRLHTANPFSSVWRRRDLVLEEDHGHHGSGEEESGLEPTSH